jgi:2-oxoglutarate ferredoxin oxidoreductase subunit delta
MEPQMAKGEAKGEIVILDYSCKGCALCVEYCPKGCIQISKDKFNASGALLPEFVNVEECIACKICGNMCPDFAIEVYKYVDEE